MSERRKLAPCFERLDVSVSRACALIGVSRRRLSYAPKRNDGGLVERLVRRLMELAKAYPRFGSRQLCRMLRREGTLVNLKRVRRLCRRHGLLLKQRRRRKRLGIGVGMPCRAEYPNHVWSYDFVEDRTMIGSNGGRKLRILTIVDDFTRRCIEVEVEHRMNAKFVAQTLLRLFTRHGVPKHIRSDNGPEFIARFLMRVLVIHGVEARHIDPGSPWQNGIDERFNGTLRDECLNMETFHNRDHARALIKLFARFYNDHRPHSSLGREITPNEFYEKWKDKKEGGGELSLGLRPKPRDLSLCASSGRGVKKGGPTAPEHDRPDDRQMIHAGAPVASQQSRILRVDDKTVRKTKRAGKFPTQDSTT